jgi:hypothetical protein
MVIQILLIDHRALSSYLDYVYIIVKIVYIYFATLGRNRSALFIPLPLIVYEKL